MSLLSRLALRPVTYIDETLSLSGNLQRLRLLIKDTRVEQGPLFGKVGDELAHMNAYYEQKTKVHILKLEDLSLLATPNQYHCRIITCRPCQGIGCHAHLTQAMMDHASICEPVIRRLHGACM